MPRSRDFSAIVAAISRAVVFISLTHIIESAVRNESGGGDRMKPGGVLHSHNHGSHHGHQHGAASRRVLVWSLAATSAFVAFELAAGIRAHSLAGHNATDAVALLLALFAVYLHGKPADESRTFGYHRAGVLAAFVNALTLVALSVWILYESWARLIQPEPVNETAMLWVAAAAMALNGGIMLGLMWSGEKDINIRGAFLHMLGDLIGAAAIVAGAIVIRLTGWTRIDPILSILISGLVVWTAWDIIRESLNILLEGLPRGLHLREVKDAIRGVEGVLDVHDLHIWSLGSNSSALSCHVLIEDMPPSRSDRILHGVNHVLGDRFRLYHTTVQFEHMSCAISDTGCVIPVDAKHAHDHGHGHDHAHHDHAH
jgi:cobalt-zinc-cadmium efflux system protein